MIETVSIHQINKAIEIQKEFYQSELIQMGYFKTPEGLQLYELSLNQLEDIYRKERRANRE
ncbi:Fur-regulated basic protein FbpA [Bacillus cereus group sp. IBL03679]|uniref:Fur-regulated basic protein FbpA n=1 Tax=Bacillus cereus group sp. IBL03679 TaxID=3240095 RepID=UPI003D2F619C